MSHEFEYELEHLKTPLGKIRGGVQAHSVVSLLKYTLQDHKKRFNPFGVNQRALPFVNNNLFKIPGEIPHSLTDSQPISGVPKKTTPGFPYYRLQYPVPGKAEEKVL